MSAVQSSWSSAELAHALCDGLVAKGQLKEKPTFIRTDREAKIAGVFEAIGLDGEKMGTFENPGPLEMMIRKGTSQEPWVQQVVDHLVTMLPEEVQGSTKKMTMDDKTKEELDAAKERTQKLMERRENQGEGEGRGEGGKGRGRDDGDREQRGGGKGYGGDREERGGARGGGWGGGGDRDDRDERGGGRGGDRWGGEESGGGRGGGDRWGGGDREEGGDRKGKGGGKADRDQSSMQCFNCQGYGHSARDCPEPPKPKGGGKGKRDRGNMACNNCRQMGHKSRDCPEPVDEEALAERLAARKAKQDGGNSD